MDDRTFEALIAHNHFMSFSETDLVIDGIHVCRIRTRLYRDFREFSGHSPEPEIREHILSFCPSKRRTLILGLTIMRLTLPCSIEEDITDFLIAVVNIRYQEMFSVYSRETEKVDDYFERFMENHEELKNNISDVSALNIRKHIYLELAGEEPPYFTIKEQRVTK